MRRKSVPVAERMSTRSDGGQPLARTGMITARIDLVGEANDLVCAIAPAAIKKINKTERLLTNIGRDKIVIIEASYRSAVSETLPDC